MKKILLALVVMAISATGAMATLVDFTAAEGYSDGALAGNSGAWSGTAGNTVDSSGSGAAVLSAASGFSRNIFLEGMSGSDLEYTVSIVFSFDQTTGTGSREFFGIDFRDEVNVNSDAVTAAIRRGGAHWYDLKVMNIAQDSAGFHESAIGINEAGGDLTSDELMLTAVLARGASAADWSMTISVSNLTTSTLVETYTQGNISRDDAFFTASSIYAGINSVYKDDDALVSNRTIDSFETSVVPEPATLSLVVISSTGLVLVRRCLMKF